MIPSRSVAGSRLNSLCHKRLKFEASMIKRTIDYHAHYLSDGTIPALTALTGFGYSVLR
jgi:hypothetical protein